MQRRAFLSWVTGGLAAALGGAVAVPILGRVLSPLRPGDGEAATFVPVTPVDHIPVGSPTRLTFPVTRRDGWVVRTTTQAAWVTRRADDSLQVLSTVCPHLGCSVKWQSGADHFGCPCHDSEFGPDGDRRHGPAKRGLDELPHRVRGGLLEVQWVEYAAGIPERRPLGAA